MQNKISAIIEYDNHIRQNTLESIFDELQRRQVILSTEPNGIVKDTMIENLLEGLFSPSKLEIELGREVTENDFIGNGFKNFTNRQKEVIRRLEFLVHKRYTVEDLNKYLSEHFYEEIEVSDVTNDKDNCDFSDWNLMFSSLEDDTYGYFDIYFLPTREENVIFITEIGFEFENL